MFLKKLGKFVLINEFEKKLLKMEKIDKVYKSKKRKKKKKE
jgi:hypothetical protein